MRILSYARCSLAYDVNSDNEDVTEKCSDGNEKTNRKKVTEQVA